MIDEIRIKDIRETVRGHTSFKLIPFEIDPPASLTVSLKNFGILHPLIVRTVFRGNTFQLITGFKRFTIANLLNIETAPVILLREGEAKDIPSLLLAIEDNRTTRSFSPIEAGHILHLWKYLFRRKSKKNTEKVASLLGIPPVNSTIQDYLKLRDLNPELQKRIHSGRIGFEQAQVLLNTDEVISDVLTDFLLAGVHLNPNRLKVISRYLKEIARRENLSPQKIVQDSGIGRLLKAEEKRDSVTGARLQSILHSLRYPVLTGLIRNFNSIAKRLTSGDLPVNVQYPTDFEGETLTMILEVKSRDELKTTLEELLAPGKVSLFKDLFSLLHDYEV
jgi:hypothetical protein